MHVPVDETQQVKSIEWVPRQHIAPYPADTIAIHNVNKAIIVLATNITGFLSPTPVVCGPPM